jgi:dienelactone hydrolase
MMLPKVVNAVTVTDADVTVTTPDGTCDAYFVHPASGTAPGVLLWPDIFGLRPAMRQMGKRLAESGYAVLVVNPFYRVKKAPTADAGAATPIAGLMPLMQALTETTQMTDAKAFIGWLDQQSSVAKNRKMGTQGYCMGGPIALRTAAAVPDRVGAVASFHGGGLVNANPNSPHLQAAKTKAQFLIAVAANDDMALGALEALKARNLLGKVKLIGFDALPEALGQIKAGNLTATIEQLPGGQVRGALETLVAFLREGKKPDQQVILLTPIAITSDNLNQAERLNEVK